MDSYQFPTILLVSRLYPGKISIKSLQQNMIKDTKPSYFPGNCTRSAEMEMWSSVFWEGGNGRDWREIIFSWKNYFYPKTEILTEIKFTKLLCQTHNSITFENANFWVLTFVLFSFLVLVLWHLNTTWTIEQCFIFMQCCNITPKRPIK